MVKKAYSTDNCAREMEFGSFDGVDAGEHSDVGLVEISEIFATQDAFI